MSDRHGIDMQSIEPGKPEFMQMAAEEAARGVQSGDGGPFGAVIVRNGEVIARGHNMVLSSNDPTAHAEVTAIRAASKALGRFDLSDCRLYTSCEPCPMCLAAIHWARIPVVYQGANRYDAADAGFDDEYLYEALCGQTQEKRVSISELGRDLCLGPMKMWKQKQDRTPY